MGDAPARTENPAVTTGPIRGSKKIHVGPLKVAMREIYLEPSSGEPPATASVGWTATQKPKLDGAMVSGCQLARSSPER